MRSMRRVCVDIASSLYYDSRNGWLEGPNEARRHFKGKKFKFWAASTFDDLNQRMGGFTNYEELFASLVEADEIITFNGRKCDFVVLENLIGEETARALWGKTHHDLAGWRGEWSLKGAVARFLPELFPRFASVLSERLAELRDSYEDKHIARDIADTSRDVRFTYALFEKYLQSGDTDRTFSDLAALTPKERL